MYLCICRVCVGAFSGVYLCICQVCVFVFVYFFRCVFVYLSSVYLCSCVSGLGWSGVPGSVEVGSSQ